jgi:hypothetical protein
MYNRFDFEDNLMKCWHVTDDINLLVKMVGDIEMDVKHQDKLMNILIGMRELYNQRFSETFNLFEELVHEKFFSDL